MIAVNIPVSGPGRGGHLPRHAGHARQVVQPRREKQVGPDTAKLKPQPTLTSPRFTALSYAGSAFGTVISMPTCGYLCHDFGWEYV